ncbi:GAA1 [[Candida] subhashii]|uniref:GAA1 n=1 Tax=[Candida] subhashii TaxID=561895 RepID=A0A8J5QR94_9ASCO|nr:GAA1 [[Candida] subhashii]KAG7664973.1 GAA1 [[Candida] subhashii]
MALAETLVRAINKLGLVPKLIQLLPKFSLIIALISCLWLFVLPLDDYYRNTYISENALMPGQIHSYFRESEWNIVRGYRDELKKLEPMTIPQRNEIIETWLNDLGLQTSYHVNGFANDTLYAVMHAPRGENTEAMALVVPWSIGTNDDNNDNEYNEGALALAMSLTRYFTRMSIWSKNILLIFPQDTRKSLRSWVEAYHSTLDNTAGSIEAAIVIEYGKSIGDYFDYYEMYYEGLNGQLPNLDLLNTANTIARHEGIHCSIQGITTPKFTYSTRLQTLLKGILQLTLRGLTRHSPGCEAFSGWQIQAFTMKAIANENKNKHDITQFGRIVDSSFRSVNNLLEKFHQSFFFYLMLSPKNFVSIGTYLPSSVGLAVAYVLSSLGGILNGKIESKDILSNLSTILLTFVSVELACVGLSFTIPFMILNSDDDALGVSAQFLLILSSLGFLVTILSMTMKRRLNKPVAYSLISLALFVIALLITALMIVHFSLALMIGLLALPLSLIPNLMDQLGDVSKFTSTQQDSEPPKDPMTKFLQFVKTNKPHMLICLCLLISNPFFIILVGGNFLTTNEAGGIELFQGLTTSWNDLQCWTWFIVILGWFPCWILVGIGFVLYRVDIDDILSKKKLE